MWEVQRKIPTLVLSAKSNTTGIYFEYINSYIFGYHHMVWCYFIFNSISRYLYLSNSGVLEESELEYAEEPVLRLVCTVGRQSGLCLFLVFWGGFGINESKFSWRWVHSVNMWLEEYAFSCPLYKFFIKFLWINYTITRFLYKILLDSGSKTLAFQLSPVTLLPLPITQLAGPCK